jgi:hypothetical protein
LQFSHHMRADAGFDGDALNRFDTERAQDILYLTSMCFPLSFEQNLAELVDEAHCGFRNSGIQTNPVLLTCQHYPP